MNGLQKFLVCLLSVVVAVSLGVTVYYFARSNGETLALSQTECYANVGDQFTISIKQDNGNSNTTLELVSSDTSVVELVSKDKLNYTFKANKAGFAVINLLTNNENFNKVSCKVNVADGSSASPYYVRNAEDLLKIGNEYGLDKNYKQIANIDMSGSNLSPIGKTESAPFAGTYLGNGFVISNVSLTGDVDYAGLFGYVGKYAKVLNVTLDNVKIETNSLMVGAICAVNYGTVSDCTVKNATLKTTNTAGYVGGVVAQNNLAKVLTSSFEGKIYNGSKLGGVVAENINSRVLDCYSRGEFYPASSSQMGGVVCYNTANTGYRAIVVDCYSTMTNTDTSNTNVGMILFNNLNSDSTSTLTNEDSVKNRVYGNHYATLQGYRGVNGAEDNSVFVGLIADKAVVASYTSFASNGDATTWDFGNVWTLSSQVNNGYPTLKANASSYLADVYVPGITTPVGPIIPDPEDPEIIEVDKSVITRAGQLTSLMNETDGYSLSKSYTLGADIDMSGVTWTAKTFNGSLSGLKEDGSRYTIKNLTVSASESSCVGVFAVNNGIISNICFTNLKVVTDGGKVVGGLTGENRGIVRNVSVSGSADVSNGTNDTFVGGVVGINNGELDYIQSAVTCNVLTQCKYLGGLVGVNNGKLNNSDVDSIVVASEYSEALGGLVGYNTNIVSKCKSSAVLGAQTNTSATYAGGLVGLGDSKQSLTNCKVLPASNIMVEVEYLGGLVGKTGGVVDACQIECITLKGKNVAGLVSILDKDGLVSNCCTYAKLQGEIQGAGMVNTLNSGSKVSKCYVSTAFECAGGANIKYESQTAFRQDQPGTVENCVINKTVMGSPEFRDPKRQYGTNYKGLGITKIEFNLPDDHLYSADDCANAETFAKYGWDVSADSIWEFTSNGPVLK